MKLLILIFTVLILTFSSFGQFTVFDQDTAWLISDSTGNEISNWMEISDLIGDWRKFEGAAGLWTATYSGGDGMSDALIISYQTKSETDNKGYGRVSKWTVLDSIETTDVSTLRYGSGAQDGVDINIADKADPWSPISAIRFKYAWVSTAADTCEIHSILNLTEQK